MSGSSVTGGGAVAVLLGAGVLGHGLWARSFEGAVTGLGLVLVGYLFIEVGRRAPY